MYRLLKPRYLAFLLPFLLATFGTRVVGAAYLNLASIHLSRALSGALAPQFPYVLDDAGRAELQESRRWSERAWSSGGSVARLACLRLRVSFAALNWSEALDSNSIAACLDRSLHVRPAPWLVLQGLHQLQEGNDADARLSFRRAFIVGSTILGPSLAPWLQTIMAESETEPIAEVDGARPRFRVGRLTSSGFVAAPQAVGPNWELVGFTANEFEMNEALPMVVTLYWQPTHYEAQVPEGWQRVGSLWRERAHSVNLIPDGGFEWPTERLNVTAWSIPEQTAVISPDERAGDVSRTLKVMPNPMGDATIVTTPVLPLLPDCALLTGGWVKAGSNAVAAMSVVWAGVRDEPHQRAFVDVIDGQSDVPWTHISQIVTPLPQAAGVSLYFSNWTRSIEGDADLVADDAFLLPIPIPGYGTKCNLVPVSYDIMGAPVWKKDSH